MNSFLEQLKKEGEQNQIPQEVMEQLLPFFRELLKQVAPKAKASLEEFHQVLSTYFSLVCQELKNPSSFSHLTPAITAPFNHTAFAKRYIGLSLDKEHSFVLGEQELKKLAKQLEQNENVVFFANHQIEPDPQVLQLLFEPYVGEKLVDQMIFVAGDRVTKDPLAIPISQGCHLLCIYSKNYIETPKEQKEQKLLHNRASLQKLQALFAEGGKWIYVAPSGGRDRKTPEGLLQPAPFDPDSLEVFYLLSRKAKRPTHFYPLSLHTYDLLPPPPARQIALGEERLPSYAKAFAYVGEELLMEKIAADCHDKHERRSKRCTLIHAKVVENYEKGLARLSS